MRSLLLSLAFVTLAAHASTMTLSLDEFVFQAACNNPIGLIHISVTDGTPPYNYLWSDGSTLEDRDNLVPGTYSVTVTDGLGDTVSESYMIIGSPALIVQLTQAESMPCPNEANGSFIVIESEFSGLEPYFLNVQVNGAPVLQSGADQWGNAMFSGVADGDVVVISATDALGCSGSLTQQIYGPDDTPVAITNIQGECVGTFGSVSISAPFPWSTDISVWQYQGPMVHHQPNFLNGGSVGGLAAGNYMIKQTWSGLYMVPCDTIYIPLTVPYVGSLCGTVQGTSWYDVDGDCVRDVSEAAIPYSTLLIEPDSQIALTGADGSFSFPLANGSYTLEQTDPTLVPVCPVVQPVPVTVSSNITTVALANGSTEPLDLAVYGHGFAARPGFATSFVATVRNLSPQVSGPVTVSVTFDPLLTYTGALPTPTSIMGNVVTWDLSAFTSFQDEDVHVYMSVPIGTPLGTPLAFSVQASNTLPESSLSNNVTSWDNVVTGSFDPNDKVARTSTGMSSALYFIDQDEWIDYVIRFQNTGTAAASFVVITDTVAHELDMLTFEQGTASHPFNVSFKPGRVVEWKFDNINLPDSASDEPGSHGLVSFRIRPTQPVLVGTGIENTANIYFDFNDAVITEPSILTAEFSTAIIERSSVALRISPNPANEQVAIECSSMLPRAFQVIASDGRQLQVPFTRRANGYQLDIRALVPGVYVIRIGEDIARFIRQ